MSSYLYFHESNAQKYLYTQHFPERARFSNFFHKIVYLSAILAFRYFFPNPECVSMHFCHQFSSTRHIDDISELTINKHNNNKIIVKSSFCETIFAAAQKFKFSTIFYTQSRRKIIQLPRG